jgi:serine/threonine-protein kinase
VGDEGFDPTVSSSPDGGEAIRREEPDPTTSAPVDSGISPSAPMSSVAGSAAVSATVLAGRYELLGMIGTGGMGNVYKARDLELDEVVALKMLLPGVVATEGMLELFRSEVKLARRVTHANVGRVFDIGEHQGDKFLTMELVDGESLGARLRRGLRFSLARALEIAAAVCAGLGAAHAAGVVHRDLKPDNVLISRGGRVVVTDFGIARALSEGISRAAASMAGTPAYMAPEQFQGHDGDARTDIYAFGALLYEMLTGEPPWPGGSVLAVATARLLQPPPDPRVKRPDVPVPLAALVRRCMARLPGDRPASVDEVARELSTGAPAAPLSTTWPQGALPPELFAQTHPGVKRVAVLPFHNTGEPGHDYLAEGLTEDLIDVLSMSPGLRVCSRSAVMRFTAKDRDLREVGRELDVQVVVDGSVRRAGGVVRISARLISVADGFQIWARRFDRPEAEILVSNDETARAIAAALAVEINAPAHPVPPDSEVTDLYLRGRAAYHHYFYNKEGDAICLFEEALVRAPGDARILAGYAMAHARFRGAETAVGTAAREAAERAVRLEPTLAESHLAVASVLFSTGDPVGPVRPLRRALRLCPTSATAHDLIGRILSETTLVDDARRHLEAAISIDPEIELSRIALCRLHELAGEPDRADALVTAGPGRDVPLPALARLIFWRRDAVRAAEVLRQHPAPEGRLRVSIPFLELLTGGKSPLPLLARMQDPAQSNPRRRIFFSQVETEAACVLGDVEHAFASLARGAEDGLYDVPWMDRCPLLSLLRGEARFAALRARIAARAARVEEEYLAPESAGRT